MVYKKSTTKGVVLFSSSDTHLLRQDPHYWISYSAVIIGNLELNVAFIMSMHISKCQ
jgi:hypothetical protein